MSINKDKRSKHRLYQDNDVTIIEKDVRRNGKVKANFIIRKYHIL